ncbi:hypothetical protein FQZ97_1119490 [compost metagenome]
MHRIDEGVGVFPFRQAECGFARPADHVKAGRKIELLGALEKNERPFSFAFARADKFGKLLDERAVCGIVPAYIADNLYERGQTIGIKFSKAFSLLQNDG